MATIENSIKLRDGASPVLNKFGKTLDKIIGKQDRFTRTLNNTSSAASRLVGRLKGVVSAYMLFQGVKNTLAIADQLTMTTARLNLANDGLKTTAKLTDDIYASAMRSRSGFLETADAVAKLKLRAGEIFTTNDETIAFTETLNKMFAISGASQQEMYSATLQLTQALGSGVLRGEEFRAVFEAAPNVMKAIADYLDIPIGSLRDLANEGQISAQTVKNAMFEAAESVDKQFKKIPYTWSQVWTLFKNHAIKAFEPVLVRIRKFTSSTRFIAFMDGMAKGISVLAKHIEMLIWLASEFAAVIFDNWYWIAPIVWGVVAAMGAYYLVSFSAWLLDKAKLALTWGLAIAYGLYAAAKWILTSATWAEAKATAVAKAEQWGLNSAMYACPLLWIIGLVIFFAVAIYLGVKVLNKFAGTSISATGAVVGAFGYMLANVLNVGIYIWNIFASVAEFIANVFTDPIYSVKKLFVNLATNALDACIAMTKGWDNMATSFANAIIDAVNWAIRAWNKFVDFLPDSVSSALGLGKGGQFEHRASITSDLENYKAKIEGILGDKPSDYWEAPKHDFINVGAFTNKAYDWGSNLKWEDKLSDYLNVNKALGLSNQDNIKKLLNGTGGDSNRLSDIGKALTGSNDNRTKDLLDKIADNTSDIANNTSTLDSNEDFDLMKQVAERDAINRYTMSDLKIEMTNNNNVSSKLDLDDIVEYLQKKVYEGVLATANGVHY